MSFLICKCVLISDIYPPLAASVFGEVSIKDADDSESVRGDLTFAPRYPYFTPTTDKDYSPDHDEDGE